MFLDFAEFARYNCLEWLLNSLAKCNCSLDLLQIVFQNNDPEAKQHHPPPSTTLHMCCVWFSFAALSSHNVDARLTTPPSLQWSQETQWAPGCNISKNDVLVFACQVQVEHVPAWVYFFESRLEWILNSIAVIWGSGSCAKQNEAAWPLQILSWWQALFPDMAMDPGYKLHMVLCSVLCLCNASQSPLNLARLETVQTQDGEERQQSCTPFDINNLNMLLKILPSHLRSKITHLEKRTKLSSPTVLTKCTFFVCLQMILRWKRIASHWRESSSGLFEKSDHDCPGKKAVEQGWENSDHFIALVVSGWSCVWWPGEAPRWQTACKSLIKHTELS